MARPHHATVAKAEKLAIALEWDAGTDRTTATTDTGISFTHPKADQALQGAQLARVLAAEYPALQLALDEESLWLVTARDPEAEFSWDTNALDDKSLSHLLEACEDAEFDPEEGYEEEDETPQGSVVAAGYKAEYAARGNPNHCGDWLAHFLTRFEVGDKKTKRFDPDAFTDFLVANNVPLVGKWADLPNSGQKGWVGRYRMNGRQKLEQVIAQRGTVILEDGSIVHPDRDWLHAMLDKHPKIEAEWDAYE